MKRVIIAALMLAFASRAQDAAPWWNALAADGAAELPDVTDGLIGWWKLDGNVNDSAGVNNGVVYGYPSLDADGKIGKCYESLVQGGDWISCGDLGTFTNFTISYWVMLDNIYGSYPNSLSTHNSSNNGIRYEYGGPDDFVSFPYPHGSPIYIIQGMPEKTWFFITTTNGDRFKTYCDGVLVYDDTPGPPLPMPSLTIGCGYQPSRSWVGRIDDVRIYNRALSSNEVATIYNRYK